MALTFPTQAEQCLKEFQKSEKTISLAVLAKRRKAHVYKDKSVTLYTFEDGTALKVIGRGKSHKVYVELP